MYLLFSVSLDNGFTVIMVTGVQTKQEMMSELWSTRACSQHSCDGRVVCKQVLGPHKRRILNGSMTARLCRRQEAPPQPITLPGKGADKEGGGIGEDHMGVWIRRDRKPESGSSVSDAASLFAPSWEDGVTLQGILRFATGSDTP